MKNWPQAVLDALDAGTLVPRDFIWVEPRDRDTGDAVSWGAWSDLGDITLTVNDPILGPVMRTFEGAGSLVQVSSIQIVGGLEVQTATVTLSGVAEQAERLVRQYDARFAPIQMYRGYLDPVTMRAAAPPEPLFVGFVDDAPINTPAEGGDSTIVLTCASHAQELTRKGTSTRSDADQKLRNPDDDFFLHAATVGTWDVKWKAAGE